MDVHLLTPTGDQLVVQVVDGCVIVPPLTSAEPATILAQPISKAGDIKQKSP